MIKSRTSLISKITKAEADHFPISSEKHKGLVAYRASARVETNTVRNGISPDRKPTESFFSGVCKKSALDRFLSGKSLTIPGYASVKRGTWDSTITAVRPEYLEVARTQGWPAHQEDLYKGLDVEDPLTAMEKGEEYVFVEMHGAGHQLFDIDGLPLPTALRFNYIDGRFDNGAYDLLKAAKVLMLREDVVLDECNFSPYDDDDPRNYILRIPGYNSEPGRDQAISFKWMPSVEDYRRVFAAAAKIRHDGDDPGNSELRYGCFKIDQFGLRASGAALYKDIYMTKRAS